jgi:hypothetical protein
MFVGGPPIPEKANRQDAGKNYHRRKAHFWLKLALVLSSELLNDAVIRQGDEDKTSKESDANA